MVIDISKDDILTLRSQIYDRLYQLENTPAANSTDPMFRAVVEPQIKVCCKFIRKLNSACVKAFGHNCNADLYEPKNRT